MFSAVLNNRLTKFSDEFELITKLVLERGFLPIKQSRQFFHHKQAPCAHAPCTKQVYHAKHQDRWVELEISVQFIGETS
jgi:hypothetical protein